MQLEVQAKGATGFLSKETSCEPGLGQESTGRDGEPEVTELP